MNTNLWDPRPIRPHDMVPAPVVEMTQKRIVRFCNNQTTYTHKRHIIYLIIHSAHMLSNLNGGLSRQRGGPWTSCSRQRARLVPWGSDEGEVFGCRQDLPLGHGHIFFASCHHKDWLLPPYWCFNVGIGLGSEGLDLAAYVRTGKKRRRIKSEGLLPFHIFKICTK